MHLLDYLNPEGLPTALFEIGPVRCTCHVENEAPMTTSDRHADDCPKDQRAYCVNHPERKAIGLVGEMADGLCAACYREWLRSAASGSLKEKNGG